MSLHLTRGLPASGKTTWAKKWIAFEPDNRVRVNRDDLRYMMFNKGWGVNEGLVTSMQHAAIRNALKQGKDVVCDDTNLNAKNVKELLKLAAEAGTDVVWHDQFLDTPLGDLLSWDAARERSVGGHVIMDMAKRYNVNAARGTAPKRPQIDSKAVSTVARYEGTPGKPKAFLVDLDGTIALNGPDRDHPHRGYFDWAKVGGDLPNQPVIDVVRAVQKSGGFAAPVFVSGRDAACAVETRDWIVQFVYDGEPTNFPLHMRPQGDMRPDHVIKGEIFDKHIRDNYDVQFCLDDRNQVVEFYRSIGLTVFQVAEGNF